MCMAGEYFFSMIANRHINFAPSSEFPIYHHFLRPESLLIVVSQSGETADVLEAMEKDAKFDIKKLRVDGGAAVNNLLMQFQSDITNIEIYVGSECNGSSKLLAGNEMAQSKSSLTKEQLVYNISSLYLSALALKEMHYAQEKYVGALRKLEQQISDEVRFGKKAQIDLLKAQSDLQGNLSYLEVVKANIVITKASLASLVGINTVGTLERVKVSVKKPHFNTNRLLADASGLDRVIISDLNLKKAGKGIEKSQSGKLPQVSLSSYYGYNYGPNDDSNPRSGVWENQNTWQVGLNAKWTLFDFGKNNAATQKAKISRMQAELEKQQTMLDLKKSLIEAKEKLKQEYANYQGSSKQLQLAKESEKIENVRYLNGVSTINDLLYAKSQSHLARAKLIENKYNYQKGRYYLDYLLERGVK